MLPFLHPQAKVASEQLFCALPNHTMIPQEELCFSKQRALANMLPLQAGLMYDRRDAAYEDYDSILVPTREIIIFVRVVRSILIAGKIPRVIFSP